MKYKLLRQEKVVATMMVLVESIKSGKRSPDYWQAEGPWMAGETAEIMRQSQLRAKPAPSAT